jgi:hypothetical protein
MQTKKLATIFMVGALSVLLLTFGSIQSAFAGGRSGPKVTTHAGPQNPGDGPQSGGGNDPLGGSISGPRVTSGSPGITADKQPQDKLPGKKKP